MNSAAAKLKLAPSTMHDRTAGILTEGGDEPTIDGHRDKSSKRDKILFGGNVAKFPGR
jgi:hypothetical protein